MSAEGINRFTTNILYKLYSAQDFSGNVAFSGISLYVLLGAINVGLRGRSFDQLSHLLGENFLNLYYDNNWRNSRQGRIWLHLQSSSDSPTNMNSALFFCTNISSEYEQISDFMFRLQKMKSEFTYRDGLTHRINEWIYQRTHGFILKMFDSPILYENMIFIHTMFVGALWLTKFNPELSKKQLFYNNKREALEVMMMNQESHNKIFDLEGYNFRIIFKPFAYDHFFTAIILPRSGFTVKDVLENINLDEMSIYFENSTWKYIDLNLPKFQMSFRTDFVQILINLGVIDLFDRYLSDFREMTDYWMFIESLSQLANIAVDEDGVLIAAATEASVALSQSPRDESYSTKPFMFFIYSSSSKLVLFSSVVSNPNII
ncbi:Alpha-2-antiplasmin [Thelohanellus kitauei]|uniref:Alpha-2-antiplasmin n=1 Tax=Thelohanellus kitauei TaxID=669202 RepID=A0A0C2NLK4_THEKT|nr:Alpha-2-antiplasmin [Thelohanellus kitauei]